MSRRSPLLRLGHARASLAAVAAFAVTLASAIFVGLLQGQHAFWGDTHEYWALGQTFAPAGHFSLLNFQSPFRGYILPLVDYLVSRAWYDGLGTPYTLTTLVVALTFALIGSVLGPLLAEAIWLGRRWGFLRRLALFALLIVFWSGDLNYLLTDFPGLAMAMLALVAVSRPDSPPWMFLAGVALAVAINLRPAYVPLLPTVVVIVGISWLRTRGGGRAMLLRRSLCAGLLLVSFVAVSVPQVLAHHRHYGGWRLTPDNAEEERFLLTTGLPFERSDSYEPVGTAGGLALAYEDRTGRRLLEEQPNAKIKSSGEYVQLVLDHPTTMIALLARHLINGLDVRYNTIYVEHADGDGHILLRLAGFLLVFLALVRLLWSRARRALAPTQWRFLFALALCCLTTVTTALETRYMLPLYLIVYLLVLAPGWPNPLGPATRGLLRYRTPLLLTAAYVLFMAVVWHVVGNLHGHIISAWPTFKHR